MEEGKCAENDPDRSQLKEGRGWQAFVPSVHRHFPGALPCFVMGEVPGVCSGGVTPWVPPLSAAGSAAEGSVSSSLLSHRNDQPLLLEGQKSDVKGKAHSFFGHQ